MKNQKVNNVKEVIIFLNANGINQFDDNWHMQMGILGYFEGGIPESEILEIVKKIIDKKFQNNNNNIKPTT